jgi:hypothetical protein
MCGISGEYRRLRSPVKTRVVRDEDTRTSRLSNLRVLSVFIDFCRCKAVMMEFPRLCRLFIPPGKVGAGSSGLSSPSSLSSINSGSSSTPP